MVQCPKCGNSEVYRGETLFWHTVLSLVPSSKRYCYRCGEKWRRRSRDKRQDSFYLISASMIALLSLLFFKFPGLDLRAVGSGSNQESKSPLSGLMSMAAKNKGLLPLIADKKLQAKIQKYQNDPKALQKLSANQKQMIERYAKKHGFGVEMPAA